VRTFFAALEDIWLNYHEVSVLPRAFKQVASDRDWIFSTDTARDLFATSLQGFSGALVVTRVMFP